MILIRNYLILFLGLMLISNCSSSSSGIRYDQPPKKIKKNTDKSIRFSSENDPEFDTDPVEDKPVDKEEFIKKNLLYKNLPTTSSSLKEGILFEVIKYLNTPYKYGGNSKNGIDCSAFTKTIYSKASGQQLPRTAREQYRIGKSISQSADLKFGDLVFFNTSKVHYPGHVGIYLGDELFAHASLSKGVTVSSLQSTYYKTRFIGGKRINKN